MATYITQRDEDLRILRKKTIIVHTYLILENIQKQLKKNVKKHFCSKKKDTVLNCSPDTNLRRKEGFEQGSFHANREERTSKYM